MTQGMWPELLHCPLADGGGGAQELFRTCSFFDAILDIKKAGKCKSLELKSQAQQ